MDKYTKLAGMVDQTILLLGQLEKHLENWDEAGIEEFSVRVDEEMTNMVNFFEAFEGDFSDQVVNLAKSAQHAVLAANDEDGTSAMTAVAISALRIVKDLI